MTEAGIGKGKISRKTLEEYKDYIKQPCRISFFYARYLKG